MVSLFMKTKNSLFAISNQFHCVQMLSKEYWQHASINDVNLKITNTLTSGNETLMSANPIDFLSSSIQKLFLKFPQICNYSIVPEIGYTMM